MMVKDWTLIFVYVTTYGVLGSKFGVLGFFRDLIFPFFFAKTRVILITSISIKMCLKIPKSDEKITKALLIEKHIKMRIVTKFRFYNFDKKNGWLRKKFTRKFHKKAEDRFMLTWIVRVLSQMLILKKKSVN